MEERLDDAINVLRNHCEPQMLGLGGVGDPSLLAGGSLQAMANSATNPGAIKQERPGPGSEFVSQFVGELFIDLVTLILCRKTQRTGEL